MARDPGDGGPMVPGSNPGWDAGEATRKANEFAEKMRIQHLERIAERKLLRDEARRAAKTVAEPDYPWLKPGWKW